MIKGMPDGEEITRTRRLNPGMCIPGLRRRVRVISSPSGMTLIIEISTMRSRAVSTPVVSRSKKTIGRLRLSFIPRDVRR